MNKKWLWVIMPILIVLVIIIIFLYYRSKAAYSISVIGGADGPTSIFIAGELKMSASNYGGFEKVCTIGQSISRNDKQTTTKPGDIMLYNGSQLVIFYDSNSWAYTPIGHINESVDELEKFLSGDESEVVIRLVQ